MRNKIVRFITRSTVLFMTILTMSMNVGTITAHAEKSAKQDVYASTKSEIPHTSDSVWIPDQRITVYDLRDSRTYGIGAILTENSPMIDYEGFCGIKLEIKNGKTMYSVYTHNDQISDTASVILYSIDNGRCVSYKNLGQLKTGTEKTLSTKLSDGVWAVGATFTATTSDNKTIKAESIGYLYVHNGEIRICRKSYTDKKTLDNDINRWNQLMADADPADYLSNDKITYPTSGDGRACNHVSEWEAISDEIIKHDDWSDEVKVLAFVDWLAKNVAYDNYRLDQPGHKSRANLANDYTDDANFTLVNHVGVCWDYTNILTIMCRHHGIPCTSVDNDYHTFNAVWLNGGWVGIDLTDINRYACYDEDTDRKNWINERYSYTLYGGYGISSDLDSHDENIWTREKGLGIK